VPPPPVPGRGLASSERLAAAIVAAALVGFGAYGTMTGAPSTVAYLGTVVAVGGALLCLRRRPLPGPLPLALAGLTVAHLAGGLIRVGGGVLYNASPGTQALRYDHFVHAFGVLIGTVVLWMLLAPDVGPDRRRTLIALSLLAGLGLGAVNETIEFLTTIVHQGSHVGGYTNTGWDLVSNVVGAGAAGVLVDRRRKQPSAVGGR
jgi:subtilase family serine protease